MGVYGFISRSSSRGAVSNGVNCIDLSHFLAIVAFVSRNILNHWRLIDVSHHYWCPFDVHNDAKGLLRRAFVRRVVPSIPSVASLL